MMIDTVFQKIEQYLKGEISAEDFSYDFPVTYSLHASYLDKHYPALSHLLEKELKVLCKSYDPYDFYHMEIEKCLSEEVFKSEVKKIYEKAKALV